MASLYHDHNVSAHLAWLLRGAGHDVVTTRDVSLTRLSDDAKLLMAVRTGRVLVTHDRRDFMLLHDAWLTWPAHFGLAFPPHLGILATDVVTEPVLSCVVDDFLAAVPADARANQMYWWHRHDGWRQRTRAAIWEPWS